MARPASKGLASPFLLTIFWHIAKSYLFLFEIWDLWGLGEFQEYS
jgi:hypothetical protein